MDRGISPRRVYCNKGITILCVSLFSIFVIVLTGCTVTPSPDTMAKTISRYFADRQYRVISLEVGEIAPIPLKEKIYMGHPTYMVEVRSIILEVPEDIGKPWNYQKGERLTFENAVMHIREHSSKSGGWVIVNISGISMP